jgi:hypothetical protein
MRCGGRDWCLGSTGGIMPITLWDFITLLMATTTFGAASSSYTGSAGIGVGTPEFHTFLGGTAVGQVFGMPNNPAGQSSGTPNGSSTFQVIGRK